MKSYTLERISGTDFTVLLNGTALTVSEFESTFFSKGEAQFIFDTNASGFTLWDSSLKDGKSIVGSEDVKVGEPYNGSWENAESGASSNAFTSFGKADGIGLTKYQLSDLMNKIKDAKFDYTDIEVKASDISVGKYNFTFPGKAVGAWYRIHGNPGVSWTLAVNNKTITQNNSNTRHDYWVKIVRNIGGTMVNRACLIYDDYNATQQYSPSSGDGTYLQTPLVIVNVSSDSTSGTSIQKILTSKFINDNLTSTNANMVLSANQGKILNDRITEVGNTTYWGQSVSNGVVTGDIDLGNAGNTTPKNISSNAGNNKVSFTYASPDNGEFTVGLYADNPNTQASASLIVRADSAGGIDAYAPLNMRSNKITNLATPTNGTDAVTKSYVDGKITGAGTRKASATGWVTSSPLDYVINSTSNIQGAMFYAGDNMGDNPEYVGIGINPVDTPADGLGARPYLVRQTLSDDGSGQYSGTVASQRIALYAEVPSVFTTNEWNALWS